MSEPFILGLICARGGSKGVPRKNIKLLNGKPLIAYSIEDALRSKHIKKLVVSTDDREIADVSKSFGAEVPFIRPSTMAEDTSSEWLVWRHAIETMESIEKRKIDILVNIPATSPLRSVDDINSCIEKLIVTDADGVISVCESSRNPYYNMIVFNGDYVKIAVSSSKPIARRQDAPSVFDVTTVAYAVKRDFVMDKNGLFDGKISAVVVPRERAIDIDTEFDFELAEFFIQKRKCDHAS